MCKTDKLKKVVLNNMPPVVIRVSVTGADYVSLLGGTVQSSYATV